MGSKTKKENRHIVHIDDIIPIERLKTKTTSHPLTIKKWESIKEKAYRLYPDKEILGWYGIRSGWEAMLTEQDQRIHQDFFTNSWHIIYLLDDISGSNNFFYWNEDKLKLCSGYYQYGDNNGKAIESKASKFKKLIFGGSGLIIVLICFFLLHQRFGQYYFQKEDGVDVYQNPLTAGQDYEQLDVVEAQLRKELDELKIQFDKLEDSLKSKEEEMDLLKEKLSKQAEDITPSDTIIYTIQRGDTLSKISKDFYGDENYNIALGKFNRIKDHKALEIGSHIIIPTMDELEHMGEAGP